MTTTSTLFHYTSAACWREIQQVGVIHATSGASDRMGISVKPVWLTDGAPQTTGPRNPDQPVVRISLAPAPAVRYWLLWRELCSNRSVWETPGGAPASWYVSGEPISAEHWGPVIRMDTGETLLESPTASAMISAWAPMPIATRLAEAARRVDRLRPYDVLRAAGVDRQISMLKAMVARGESEQRLRAAWRTLKAELALFQDQHQDGDASLA